MPDELPVHISREELHAIEVPPEFETDGPFDVRLINHGESMHAHLHLDESLSGVASLDASNHYVESESERLVRIDVATDRLGGSEVFGKLKLVSAYGAETRWVTVTLTQPTDGSERIQVDESLAKPQPEPPSEPDVPVVSLLVGGLAVVAALVATTAALLFQETLVVAGALVVLAAAVVALAIVVQ